jgi:acyl carrier protein
LSENATIKIEDKIRSYIVGHYPALETKGLGNDAPLVGVLDSLAVLGLIGFIEPEFSIELNPSDVTDENFGTITSIVQLVQRLSRPGN